MDQGEDDKASLAINQHVGLLLKQGMVEDMSDSTAKSSFDENGDPCSFKDAYYVVDPGQKIVKEGNELYLLKPGQSFQSLNAATKGRSAAAFF